MSTQYEQLALFDLSPSGRVVLHEGERIVAAKPVREYKPLLVVLKSAAAPAIVGQQLTVEGL